MTFKNLISNINDIHKTLQTKALSLINLKIMRQFYLAYPQISQTVSNQFKIEYKKRLFYEVKTIKVNWSVKE